MSPNKIKEINKKLMRSERIMQKRREYQKKSGDIKPTEGA